MISLTLIITCLLNFTFTFRIELFSWKRPTWIIKSNCLTTSEIKRTRITRSVRISCMLSSLYCSDLLAEILPSLSFQIPHLPHSEPYTYSLMETVWADRGCLPTLSWRLATRQSSSFTWAHLLQVCVLSPSISAALGIVHGLKALWLHELPGGLPGCLHSSYWVPVVALEFTVISLELMSPLHGRKAKTCTWVAASYWKKYFSSYQEDTFAEYNQQPPKFSSVLSTVLNKKMLICYLNIQFVCVLV